MKYNYIYLALMAIFTAGCAMEASAIDGEDVAEVELAEMTENALEPNGIFPNGLSPNGLSPNGLSPNGLSPSSIPANIMSSLQDPGEGGRLSRLFMRYAVSCAFDPAHSFTVSWTDPIWGARSETYWGSLALATEWQSGPLSANGKKWVTACVGARANQYAVSVVISMRNTAIAPALTADSSERTGYSYREPSARSSRR